MIKVEKLYNSKQLLAMKMEYATLEEHQLKRLNNLFHLKARRPEPKTVCCVPEVSIGGGNLVTNYYLDYEVDSFSRIHRDLENEITAVTLLEKSDDLVGGEIVLIMPFERKHYEHPFIFDSMGDKKITQGDYAVPVIVPMEVGETVLIEGQPHGVTKVTKGMRRVHVGWWS